MLTALEWTEAHHYYVHDKTKLSIDKMREEAQSRAFDRLNPEHSVIHHHSYVPRVGWCIQDGAHDQYRAGEGLVG